MQFLVDILPLGSGDPHIFAGPDPGSQNLTDPSDSHPDPKHWTQIKIFKPIKIWGKLVKGFWVMIGYTNKQTICRENSSSEALSGGGGESEGSPPL